MLQTLQSLDLWLFDALRSWNAPWFDATMSWVTLVGARSGVWLFLALIGLIFPGTRASAWRVVLALSLSLTLTDNVFKPAFNRGRPAVVVYDPPRHLPLMPRTLSFPSGHASSAFAGAVTLSRMWPHVRIALWPLAMVVAYSRIYIGHHYPSDVVGGALMGVAIALWVLGGRHPATYVNTLPRPLPDGVAVRP